MLSRIKSKRTATSVSLTFLVMLAVTKSGIAHSEGGHHVIAVMAIRKLPEEKREKVIELLRFHPRFVEDFGVPKGIKDEAEYLIGQAACWPETVEGSKYWRPKWSHNPGYVMTIGAGKNVLPEFAMGNVPNATMDTKELHLLQAIELCSRVLRDRSEAKEAKALAICWMCNLVAEAHQPCNAGSMYSRSLFPKGDDHAKSIPIDGGVSLHTFWDQRLGKSFAIGTTQKKIREIQASYPPERVWRREIIGHAMASEASAEPAEPRELALYSAHSPKVWIAEAKRAGITHVYSRQVLGQVGIAARDGGRLSPIKLGDIYIQDADDYAQQAAVRASERLAYQLVQIDVATP